MMIEHIKSNIWKYYVFNFFTEFTIFLPFIVYYFQELGFSLGQIAILQSITAITIFIFEIPSGYIADKIGRKNSLIISAILQLVGVIILFSSKNYLMLIFAHIFNGLAMAFVSGADSAFIYDSLLFLKRESEYKRIEGKAKFFGEIAIIISAVLGSLIIAFGIKQTILLTMIGYTILVFVTFSFTEPQREIAKKHKINLEIFNLFSIIKKSLYNKKLLGLFCYSFIILGISNTIFIMYQPYFRATTLPLYYYGYVFAAFSIFTAITALKAHYIERKIGVYWSLLLMPLFLACALIGGSLVFMWAGFMFFFLRELVRGYIFPVLGDYTNKIVNSSERATVLSMGSMFARLGFVVISITFGFLSDNYGIKIMLLAMGILLIAITAIIPISMKNNSLRPPKNRTI
ncbi:MAG: MFS transporter [Candidatus Woesearchaeota archaeon]